MTYIEKLIEYGRLIKEYRALPLEERNSIEGEEKVEKIRELKAEMTAIDKGLGWKSINSLTG